MLLWLPWFTQVGHIYTFNVRVTDSQGAFDEETLTIAVVYSWSGFLSPKNGATYRAGKAVPVEFRLTGVSALIADADARLFISRVVNGRGRTGDAGDALGLRPRRQPVPVRRWEYSFDWNTKGLAIGTLPAPCRPRRRRGSDDRHQTRLVRVRVRGASPLGLPALATRQTQNRAAALGVRAVFQPERAAVRLGDLPAERQADAGPVGLVVKNGTNRLDVSGSPGPSSSTFDLRDSRPAGVQSIHTCPPVSSVASTALRTMLISSCSS